MNILHNGGRWYIDQIALYLAMQREANQISVHALPGHVFLNIHYDADAVIWSITNDKRAPDSIYSKRRLALLAAYGLD